MDVGKRSATSPEERGGRREGIAKPSSYFPDGHLVPRETGVTLSFFSFFLTSRSASASLLRPAIRRRKRCVKTSGNGRCAAGFALCQATNSRGRCGRRDARGTARKRRPSSPRRSRLLRKGSAAGQCEARSEDGETWIVSFCLSSLLRLSSFPLFRLSLSFCFLSFTVFFSCLSSFIVFPSFCLTSVFFSLLFRLSLSCSLFMSVVFSLKVEHSVGTCYFYSNTIFSMIVCFDCE